MGASSLSIVLFHFELESNTFPQELLQAVHEHSSESQIKVQKSETYDRACDILNISRQELDMFFSACEKGNRQNEVRDVTWLDMTSHALT